VGWGRHRGSSLKPAFILSGPEFLCNTSVVPNIVNKACSSFVSLIMQYVLYLRISTRVTDLKNSYIFTQFHRHLLWGSEATRMSAQDVEYKNGGLQTLTSTGAHLVYNGTTTFQTS
jgi:hypothetical protein